MKKRLISIWLCAVIVLSAAVIFPVSTEAATANEDRMITMFADFYNTYKTAVNEVANAIASGSSRVDISSSAVPYADREQLMELVLSTRAELFFVKGHYSYGTFTSGGKTCIRYVNFNYNHTEAEQRRISFARAAQDWIARCNSVCTSGKAVELALALHDLLGYNLNAVYDNDRTGDVYTAMTEGAGNSYSTSVVYSYLLARLGIKSEIIKTNKGYYCNKICLSGKYYFADVYADSTMGGAKLCHNRFLLGDSAMSQVIYGTYTSAFSSDTAYDNKKIHDMYGKVGINGNYWYAISNSGATKRIAKYRLSSNSLTLMGIVSGSNNSSCDSCDGILYYNTSTEVEALNMRNNEVSSYAENKFGGTIVGIECRNGGVYVSTTDGSDVYGSSSFQIDRYIHQYPDFVAKYGGAVDRIVDGIKHLEREIDITRFKVPVAAEGGGTNDIRFRDIVWDGNPELGVYETYRYDTRYHAVIPLTFVTDSAGQYYTTAKFDCPYLEAEVDERIRQFEERVNWYLKGIDDEMSDMEKVIYLHDKIVQNVVYIPEAESETRAYQALVEGKGNCYSRSHALAYLLSKVHVNCEVTGESNHSLNKVYLDGKWYIIDSTWADDETSHRIWRNDFLISDELRKGGDPNHIIYTSFEADKKYDNYMFHDSCDSHIRVLNGKWYMINGKAGRGSNRRSLMEYDIKTNTAKVLYTFTNDKWWDHATAYSDLDEYNGIIYYNKPGYIMKYNPSTNIHSVFAVNTYGKPFVGVRIEDGVLYAEVADKGKIDESVLKCIGNCDGKPATAPALNLDSLNITGGKWLSSARWEFDPQRLTLDKTSTGFEMIIKDVPAGTHFFKLFANGDRREVFGMASETSSSAYGTQFLIGQGKSSSFKFTVPQDCSNSMIVFRVNTENYDPITRTGAVVSTSVVPQGGPSHKVRLVGNGQGSWLSGASWDYDSSELLNTVSHDGTCTYSFNGVTSTARFFIEVDGEVYGESRLSPYSGGFNAAVKDSKCIEVKNPKGYDKINILITARLISGKPHYCIDVTDARAMMGDVNLDGRIDIMDATMIQRYISQSESLNISQRENADVDRSGSVTIADATTIQKYIAKIIFKF